MLSLNNLILRKLTTQSGREFAWFTTLWVNGWALSQVLILCLVSTRLFPRSDVSPHSFWNGRPYKNDQFSIHANVKHARFSNISKLAQFSFAYGNKVCVVDLLGFAWENILIESSCYSMIGLWFVTDGGVYSGCFGLLSSFEGPLNATSSKLRNEFVCMPDMMNKVTIYVKCE